MKRLALVHCGSQVAAFERIAPRLRGGTFAAVVEADENAAQRMAKQLGAAVWATSPQQLHEQHDDAFDAWVALTPLGLLAASHDKRPLDLRPDSWTDNAPGWMWGHAFRFMPSVRTLQEHLSSGKLGEPGLLRCHHWQASSVGDARHALLPLLDVACWLVKQTPTLVFAQARPVQPAAVPLSYLQVHLSFADDRMALLDCSTGMPAGDEYFSLSVIGSTGAAYADDHHNMQLVLGGDHAQARRTSQGDFALLGTLQDFVESATQMRPPLCGLAEWKVARQIAAAAERSLASGQSEAVNVP